MIQSGRCCSMIARSCVGVGVRRRLLGRDQLPDLARVEQRPAQRLAAREELRLLVGRRDDRRDADDRVRLRELRRRLERRAIGIERGLRRRRREMRGERIAHAELARGRGARAARAEQPDRRQVHRLRHDAHRLERMAGGKPVLLERHHLGELLGEVLAAERAQRLQRPPVAAPCPADAEIDAARIEPVERAVGLDHAQRHMVGQHHAARADADGLGMRRGRRDQHVRRGRGDRGHAVMLGVPDAGVAERFAELGERDGLLQRVGRGGAFGDGREVEDGEGEGHRTEVARRDAQIKRNAHAAETSPRPARSFWR